MSSNLQALMPTPQVIKHANITKFMAELNLSDVKTFHRWTVDHYPDFWQRMIQKLKIQFKKPPEALCDVSQGVEAPLWLPGALMNIADSCFTAPATNTALIYLNNEKKICHFSYGELNELSNRIANGLIALGLAVEDPIAIVMPMNIYAIAIYLGIIKMGGVVVSVADSFSSQEMAVRFDIAKTKAVFTQDVIAWNGKNIPLYQKVKNAHAPKAIVLSADTVMSEALRSHDIKWHDFLSENTQFESVPCTPMMACNILFSSGTTGAPKAIPWNHTTAIKAASDAYLHQDIQKDAVLAWPTNLGWMMGPWLIFAALINQAAIAVYADAPKDRAYGEFISSAKVTMLGLVPTLVANWRQSKCMEGLDWNAIHVFSSSGECSNADDMLYLMGLANQKPVIEYCGGTEIGGAYLTSTVVQPNYPALFSTPAMGIDFIILDEKGEPSDIGEVALIPPSIGLSNTLLNADHEQIYFSNMPKTPDGKILRRHGDQIERLPNGYYSILGRVDDTMNLGGIKVSAAEIERAIMGLPNITEVAAIAPPAKSPSQLVIYAVTTAKLEKNAVLQAMQEKINTTLNPLFKIHDLVIVDELPKTASNKIMRRLLRERYQ